MKIFNFTIRDKWGWPIETVKGQHFSNLLRCIFRINIKKTFNKIILQVEDNSL